MDRKFGVLFVAFAITALALSGCGSSGGGDDGGDGDGTGEICLIQVSGGEEYGPVAAGGFDFVTEIYTEVLFYDESKRVPVDIYVGGVKSAVYNADNHSYQTLLDRLVPAGETVHISVVQADWGTKEFDLTVCGFPDTDYLDAIAYSPSLDAFRRAIDLGSAPSTPLTVTLPASPVAGCSEVVSCLFANRKTFGWDPITATGSGLVKSFDLSAGNPAWVSFRDTLRESRSGVVENRFRWYAEYSLGAEAKITAEYLGYTDSESLSLPPVIEGTYTLTAKYRATPTGGGGYVDVSGYSEAFGITRDYENLAIPAKAGVTGTSSATTLLDVTLTGDIIGTASALAEQTLTGDVEEDGSIHGTITGTVMHNFVGAGGSEVQATISNGTFILTPQ